MADGPWTDPTPIASPNNTPAPVRAIGPWADPLPDDNTLGGNDPVRAPYQRPLSYQQYRERYPRGERAGAGLRILARGVPGVRNFVDSSPAADDLTRMYPTAVGAAQIGSGAASMFPLIRAGTALTGGRMSLNLPTQFGIGAGVTGLDSITSANPPELEEGITRATIGGILNAAGTPVHRGIFPAGIRMPRTPRGEPNPISNPNPSPNAPALTTPEIMDRVRLNNTSSISDTNAMIQQARERGVANQVVGTPAPRSTFTNADLMWALGSSAIGSGIHGVEGAILGLSAGPLANRARERLIRSDWWRRYAGRHGDPGSHALLSSTPLPALLNAGVPLDQNNTLTGQ